MAAARVARPPLAYLPYEERHPSDLWEECFHFRSRWDTESSLTSSPCQSQIRQSMSEFRRQKAINFVWLSNKLEGTLPEGASEHETNTMLRSLLDRPSRPVSDGVATGENVRPATDSARQQLEQHMMAYIKLCEKAIAERERLSEKLILEIHAVYAVTCVTPQLNMNILTGFKIDQGSITRKMASPPPLVHLPYEDTKPEELWRKCCNYQDRWKRESSPSFACSDTMQKRMSEFKKQKAINLVWMNNKLKLKGTFPKGATEYETYKLLQRILENNDTSGNDPDERDSQRQLLQHTSAYHRLCGEAIAKEEPLSEKLILEVHTVLMKGLENDGRPVKAGVYRKIPVHAGDHCFPSHEVVPTRMPEIVAEYNQRVMVPDHDPYQLASWFLLEIISLHPFEDGNGRLCRLLWCYSLMRDGLPFPTTISSGHKKAYRHYIRALKKCQRSINNEHSHLTSLTVLSVHNGWSNFFFNWDKYEKPSTF